MTELPAALRDFFCLLGMNAHHAANGSGDWGYYLTRFHEDDEAPEDLEIRAERLRPLAASYWEHYSKNLLRLQERLGSRCLSDEDAYEAFEEGFLYFGDPTAVSRLPEVTDVEGAPLSLRSELQRCATLTPLPKHWFGPQGA